MSGKKPRRVGQLMIPLTCKFCGSPYEIRATYLKRNGGDGKFCSQLCSNRFMAAKGRATQLMTYKHALNLELQKDAHRAFKAAKKRKAIVAPKSCEKCYRETRIYGHHPDYSKPLDVMWLCQKCHTKEHTLT